MLFKTKLLLLDEVSSTITYAKDYLSKINFLTENLLILAEQQTKGVGKFANKWFSPKGNLYLTAILKPFYGYSWNSFSNINIFNLLVTYSLLQVIQSVLKNCEYTIFCKWPNDIIVNNAKISGILLENISNNKQELLLASIGVNLKVAPNLSEYKTIALNEIKQTIPTPAEFSKIIINTIYNNVSNLTKDEIIANWLKYAYKLNQIINIKFGNTTKTGVFKGINSTGLILLETNSIIETISVGEIY